MDSFLHTQQSSNVKLCGLDHGLDLDADKINNNPISQFQWQQNAEMLKMQLRNQPFDPNHMEINIRNPVYDGNISFDPSKITFG